MSNSINEDNKKTKTKVNRIKNKNTRIYIVIAILILLVVQFIVLGLSQAQRLVEIEVQVNDSANLLPEQNMVLNAIDSGDSGFYWILPDKVNNMYVTEYQVETTSIDESGTVGEPVSETRVTGDMVFLTAEEMELRQTSINVVYNTKEKGTGANKKLLYYQDIYIDGYTEKADPLSNMLITGFMPLNLTFNTIEDENAEVISLMIENLEEHSLVNKNLKFEFKLNEETYNIAELKNELQVSMFPTDPERVYSAFSINKKAEYIGKENVVDALGNPINTYNISTLEDLSVVKESLKINIPIIEYLVVTSKKNDMALMQRMSDVGIMGMEAPVDFDINTGTSIWDGSVSTAFVGAGTVSDPYLLMSGADFAYLRDRVNAGTTFENNYFQLTNNIDLDNREWEPIGSYTASFRGNLDGAGRTIKNGRVIATGTLPTTAVLSFGFFSSIGGGNSRQVIQNLEFDNVSVEVRIAGNTTTSTIDRIFGLNVGTLAGTIYMNSTISNVNVKNMSISDTGYYINIRTYRFQYAVGGLVGEAIRLANSPGDPGAAQRYSIINSVVSGNINLISATRNYSATGQFAVGGIIGRIRSQPTLPENSLFIGNISSYYSFVGPIFGQLRNATNVNNTGLYNALWQGNDAGAVICSSKYNSYNVNTYTFTSTEITGTSVSRIRTNANGVGYVQGVNKGIYDADNNGILADLNAAPESNNVSWTYSTATGFSLRSRLRTQVTENPEFTYSVHIEDLYDAGAYTYQWTLNEAVNPTTTSVYVLTEPNFTYDIDVLVKTKDANGYYSVFKFRIPKLYVEIVFNINTTNNTAEAIITGPGMAFTSYDDYSFQWYTEDISGYEEAEVVGATDRFITNLDSKHDYKLIATNNVIPELTIEDSFTYADRVVVYVNEVSGSNNNDGFAPERAVQNYTTAYSRLRVNGTRDENIIVNMGRVRNNDIFTGENSATFRRNVTITGVYKKTDYQGILHLDGATTYKFMNGDTTFMYLNIDGTQRQLYWYLQGYSLTMGEQVVMTNYPAANTNQGLITGAAPAFHIFAAWHRYNYATLPRNNPKILIKSGTFGRIVLGGSPGTNAVANLEMYTSRNFTGSGPNDMFNIEATIDIRNSTTTQHAYDVNLFVGGAACGNTYANVTENIVNGRVGRVLGSSIGDTSNRPTNWPYPINTFLGTVEINVSGGEITELYGGALGRNMSALTGSSTLICDSYFYGTVDINITGGRIISTIYGAGAGGVSGYDINSSDVYKSYGENYDTSININISGGTIEGDIYGGGYGYTNYLTERVTAFDGGFLYGTSNINITESPTISGIIYGAGRGYNLPTKPLIAGVTGQTNISIEGTPTITGTIYGAGAGLTQYPDMAKLTGESKIDIDSTFGVDVYGGGNIAATVGNTRINILSGTHTGNIYGGGNIGVVDGNTYITMTGGNSSNVFGGGNQAAVTTSNIYLNDGEATYVYGGGNQAGVTTTNITLDGAHVTRIMGGSNLTGVVNTSNIVVKSGTADLVAGGNNQGGTTNIANVRIENGTVGSVYGGGNEANSNETHVTVLNGTITNVYGGSNAANATTTDVKIQGGTITGSIFGGSNTTGIVENSSVLVTAGTMQNVFGGNNAGGMTNNSNVVVNAGTITNIYGGGNSTNSGITNVEINGGAISGDIFGGSNLIGTVQESNVLINAGNINNVYGGNNAGGTTLTPNVIVEGGTIATIYGGGNMAVVPVTNVVVNAGTIGNIYGGGNAAEVTNNTNVKINGGTINENIYGGGNEGIVRDSTFLDVENATIIGSVYAGGNGITAVVHNNTNVNIEKGTVIGSTTSNIPAQGCVFGGGNAAETGISDIDSSIATVNIVGGEIFGNVYGGANTSVVYGSTNVNIGINASSLPGLTKDNIYIFGTIFGGGEANASGSEVYDFSFISVTQAINILIDGSDHTIFNTEGSVFGSGNASSTAGISKILIKNYGALESPGKNISLQRANTITLDNTHISLSGATDRTNEYSNVNFSVSRVDHLRSSNNSTVYMAFGANLLKEYSSLVTADGTALQTVTIDPETGATTRNVDNRVFMLEGKNLNIATNESVTAYGQVNGMSFLGIYTSRTNPNTSTGLYHHSYNNGDFVSNPGTFSYNSYVLAQHKVNHDITVDGFYTNRNVEDYIKSEYVGVTPEDDLYYIWLVGEALDVTTFEITLTASKYATLGTFELPLTGFSTPNTTYRMAGFSAGMEHGIELVHVNDIAPIAPTEALANSLFGLSLRASRSGWKTVGGTDYYTRDGGQYEGRREYHSEDSATTPSFLFYLYHSQNLSLEQSLGEARIRFQVLVPIDDLNYEVKYIDINVTMVTALYQDDFYEAAITPGEEFSLFTTTETNITNRSTFSSYFSLFIPEFSENKHYENFASYHRVLVSRRDNGMPFYYPAGTKFTMLDLTRSKTYYYVVSLADEVAEKYIFKLSDFIEMGTTNKMYDETLAITDYINIEQNLVYENFIFHTDFSDSSIEVDSQRNSLWMELQNNNNQTLIGVLGIARDRTKYSIYTNKDSVINLTATVNPATVYLGDIFNLNISTSYEQAVVGAIRITDTRFFDQQMGLRITLIDHDGNQLGVDSLLGVRFKLGDQYFMPRVDGSVRMKIADNVSNVISRIEVDTTYNKTLATGDYTLQIESFGSADGIYYGDGVSQTILKDIRIINKVFGLKVETLDEMKIVNKDTGITEYGTNAVNMYIDYQSGLTNPRLNMHLERRKYESTYQREYEKVDLADYVTTTLISAPTAQKLEYIISTAPVNGRRTQFLNLKPELKTGTYRLVVSLYDGTKLIGTAYDYVIIK